MYEKHIQNILKLKAVRRKKKQKQIKLMKCIEL